MTELSGQTDLKEQREETGLPYKGQRPAGMLKSGLAHFTPNRKKMSSP
jgi:hypothetical protein